MSWGQWYPIPDLTTTPGAPVTAVVDDIFPGAPPEMLAEEWESGAGDTFQLFVADANGEVYTVRLGGRGDWAWKTLSQGSTIPGAPVAAVLDGDDLFQVFVADPGGGVFTARGSKDAGWGQWQSLSQGSTTPGAPVTAVLDGELFQVFLADPGGGVFTARGSKDAGWGQWQSLSQGSTTPGAPVTAVLDGELFQVFLADPGGGVFTARGSKDAGWGQWQSLSQGSTTPGGTVTAVLDGELFQVFLADPGGGVFTARGSKDAGWGQWKSVSQGSTMPGAPVTAFLDRDAMFQVFVANQDGGVFTVRGNQDAGWGQWKSVSRGSTMPGALVSAVRGFYGDGFFFVFVSNPEGDVYTATNQGLPAAPADLRVTSVGNESVDLVWDDASDNEDGFRISYHGTRTGQADEAGTHSVDANVTTASLTSLLSGYEYALTVAAFNSVGLSDESNEVNATTTNTPFDAFVTLVKQPPGPEGSPAPQYAGQYPALGTVQPGHVLSISVPSSTEVEAVGFAKETGGNEYVSQGTTTTTPQMKNIFDGVAKPPYTSTQPVMFLALVERVGTAEIDQVQIVLKLESD